MTSFLRRVVGALGLDAATFEEIERSPSATWQALAVVLLASLSAGIGNAGAADAAPRAMLIGTAASLLAWVTWAALTMYLATRIMPTADTRADLGQLLRTLGFAAAPGLFRGFEIFGGTGWLILPLTSCWMLAAMIVAIRQALDYDSTARAVALAGLGWAVSAAVAVAVGLVFAVPVS